MDDLHKKVADVLQKNLKGFVDWLDDVPEPPRVLGAVVSSDFENLEHRERQQLLWKYLNAVLTPAEAEEVGPIVAMTPAEATVKA